MDTQPRKFPPVLLTLLLLAGILIALCLILWLMVFIQGNPVAVLAPMGSIARDEMNLMSDAVLLMLIVVIPVFILTFAFAWRYRAGNPKAAYDPDTDQHPAAEIVWWGVPIVIITLLATITWHWTHALDPYKPLKATEKPLRIEVVALDWKWLFFYPEQGIAVVNSLEIPEKTPIVFALTADAPMNSFWIPQLGGQIYAMPGMKTMLHLIADQPGSFYGTSANLSGKGFAGMDFITRALPREQFDSWVEMVKISGRKLTFEAYNELKEPSEKHPITYYSGIQEGLFDWIVAKYMEPPTGKQVVKKVDEQ